MSSAASDKQLLSRLICCEVRNLTGTITTSFYNMGWDLRLSLAMLFKMVTRQRIKG